MATNMAASTYDVEASVMGIPFVLSVTVRIAAAANVIKPEQLEGMVAHTIATWQRVIAAVYTNSWEIAPFADKAWPSAEEKQGIKVDETEPFVTVWNKEWNSKTLSVTVHSWDNGYTALFTAHAMLKSLIKIQDYALQFGFDKLNFAPLHALPQESPKQDINNVDDFIPPYTGGNQAQQQNIPATDLPFRFFKRLAPNVIQLQEFKQGGGVKFEKSATEATLSYHKNNPQYDENALIYFPITGAIQIKEGNFGRQALIPTSRGVVYVDATNKEGQEKPEWNALSGDLHDDYSRLANDEKAQLFPTNSVLVLKMSALKDNKQWKNYYHIYQELPKDKQ